MPLVFIGIGGFAGAISRYLVDGLVTDRKSRHVPMGHACRECEGLVPARTLFAMTAQRAILPAEIRGPVMIDFIGEYTTFSTYMLESWQLIESGSYGRAIANLGGSILIGVVAIAAGLVAGRAL